MGRRVLNIAVIAAMAAPLAIAAAPAASASSSDGIVTAVGAARFAGSPGRVVRSPLVGIAGLATGNGYWIARADGGVYSYGSALSYGGHSTTRLSSPVVAIAAHPDGAGYWIVTATGAVFGYGSAHGHGQPRRLNAKVVAIVATSSGNGYWLVANDGGVMSFGDAHYYGGAFGYAYSFGGVVAAASSPSGYGYYLLTKDGAVFAFGDGHNFGGTWPARSPMVGIAASKSGGYVTVDDRGSLRAFGPSSTARLVVPRGARLVGAQGGTHYRPGPSATPRRIGAIASVAVAFDQHTVGIAGTASSASFWVVNGSLPSGAVIASFGSTGALVKSLQYNLLTRGFWLRPTGVFDNETEQAVYAFQKYTRRPRSGVLTLSDYNTLLAQHHVVPRSPRSAGRLVELDLSRQIVMFVSNGTVDWLFNTSTGSGQPYTVGGVTQIANTPTGHFAVVGQVDGLQNGRLGALWRPKYFTSDGIAFHGSPSVPPYPASHGCSRLSNPAIDFLWATNQLPLGTPVWVY